MARPKPREKLESGFECKVLTMNELCEYLRVHKATVYRLLRLRKFPGFRIGSDWRFNIESVDEWRMKEMNAINGMDE